MKWILASIFLTLILGVIAGASVLWLSVARAEPRLRRLQSKAAFRAAKFQALQHRRWTGSGRASRLRGVHVGPFMGDHGLHAGRILAVVIAVILASGAQIVTGAKTPAGGATALIVALGLETTTWMGAVRLVVGIVTVTTL